MKKSLALLALTSLFSLNALADITTYNSWRPIKDAKDADVISAIKALNNATKNSAGLISKKTYYMADTKTYVDIVVWRDQESADKVSKEQADKPEFEKLGAIIDMDSIQTSELKPVE